MKKPSSSNKQIAAIAAAVIGCATFFGYNSVMHARGVHDRVSADRSTGSAEGQGPVASAVRRLSVVPVEQHVLRAQLSLPGQLLAFQDVPLHAKVKGYVSSILVDRGSIVHQGQLLATISAPEVNDGVKEAEAKQSEARSSFAQAQADYQAAIGKQEAEISKLQADRLTYARLGKAAKTPGAIAGNELDLAREAVSADQGQLDSLKAQVQANANLITAAKQNLSAVHSVVDAHKAMRAYLEIRAPFDGVITERNVHEGSIVAGNEEDDKLPMLRIQQENELRLVVAVPETDVSGVKVGMSVPFTVPAFPGKTFTGVVARPAYALDEETRTMPVELNVANGDSQLEPGMFATVQWNVSRPYPSLFLPSSAIGSDLQGTFVVACHDGKVERVPVKRGHQMGSLVEVIGAVQSGELVALSATDDIASGTAIQARLASQSQVQSATHHTSSASE